MKNLYCTFYLDGLYYGISIEYIQEILQNQEIISVPLANSSVAGLINLRGHIISILDLKLLLESNNQNNTIVTLLIANTSCGLLGLKIDDVDEIIQVSEEDKEISIETFSGRLKELIAYTYKLSDKLMLVINVENVASFALKKERT